MGIENIQLTDLIDARTLQKIQDAFANATGMAALTVDLNGPVTQLSNPTDFCMNLTRKSRIGAERCNQCDLRGGEEAGRTGHPSVYYCHGGLMDFAAPILVEGRQIGSLIGGQVLPVPCDEEKIRAIAREIQVNEEDYIRAIRKIRIIPKKSIEAAAQLLYIMANSLSDMGYQRYRTLELNQELTRVSESLYKDIQHIVEVIESAKQQNDRLVENFSLLSRTTDATKDQIGKTNGIIKYINDISLRSRLLGMNASVEAAHAGGAAGKSFGVIAQEIRSLAEQSSQQANEINHTLDAVKQSIISVEEQIAITGNDIRGNNEMMDGVAKAVSRMDEVAASLSNLSGLLQRV